MKPIKDIKTTWLRRPALVVVTAVAVPIMFVAFLFDAAINLVLAAVNSVNETTSTAFEVTKEMGWEALKRAW